jgi:hypothetical protein
MPTSTDPPGGALPEASDICCDPMFAAGDAGDLWFGGLTLESAAPSRIVVNRIAAGGTTFQPLTVGLPSNGAGTQDKPMMTIDNGAGSPHHGRLYVVWDEPSGAGVRVVASHCDTLPDVAACDDADGWSAPVPVTPASGSFIYADAATAPDGRLYVTWWDYSHVNAIVGKVSADGGATFGATQTIAQLNKNAAGDPLPFGCPILVQPGGRVGPVPGVEVDPSGRVYVSWGDLRPGSGTTRCEMDASGDFTPPRASHLSWDAFVASAAGRLPGGAGPSAAVGTRLHADNTEGLAASADDFFPWLAVDQGTGAVWADFYSTGHDPTRRSAHFYAVAVEPTASGHRIGRLNRLSAAPSSYSSADPSDCCQFQNDFGDYEGLAAAGGRVVPSWSDNSSGTRDGEAYVWTGALSSAPPAATPTPTPTPTPSATPGPSPSPAPTASPAPTSTPAPTPPRGGLGDLDVESRQLLATVLRRGVRADIFCLRACTATTTLTVDTRTARRYHVPRRVGRLRRALPGGRYRAVRVKLNARSRRGLRRARRVKVVVRTSVGRVAAGEVAAITARLTLERRR